MSDLFSLKGRRIAFTGGYGHLGRSVCQALANAGATVIVLARSKEKYCQAFSADERKHIHFAELDICDQGSIRGCYAALTSQYGALDALVNNAFALENEGTVDQITPAGWRASIAGCLDSVFHCTMAALPLLRSSSAPRVVNVSSMYGLIAPDFAIYEFEPELANPPHYGVAKAGVLQLTRYFASLLGPEGILVNSVVPGPFPSQAVQENEAFVAALAQKTALLRIGKPEELAGIFVYLCSAAASYTTGQSFVIDGGWTIKS